MKTDNLRTLISNEEMEALVRKKEAKFINWGQKRKEIAYIGRDIYYQHTPSHYHYLGKKDPMTKEKITENLKKYHGAQL